MMEDDDSAMIHLEIGLWPCGGGALGFGRVAVAIDQILEHAKLCIDELSVAVGAETESVSPP
jgi:hypothetical protein